MEKEILSPPPVDFTGNRYMDYAILSVIILGGAIVVSSIIHFFLTRFFERSSRLLKVDPTNYRFFKNGVRLGIISLAIFSIFYIIPEFHALGITLFASAGIFAAIAGFASQAAFSNIVAGVFVVIFRPFRVGDFVQFSTLPAGIVEDITMRHTVIRTFENRRIVVPNSIISQETIMNSSLADEPICQFVEFVVSHESDVDLAIEIIRQEAMKHPDFLDRREPFEKDTGIHPIDARIVEIQENGPKVRAYIWTIGPTEAFALKTDLYSSVRKKFKEAGIILPYPTRKVLINNSGINENP